MIIDYSFPAATAAHLQRNLNSTANADANANGIGEWRLERGEGNGESGVEHDCGSFC